MEATDEVVRLLEDCCEYDQPTYTIVYVGGELHVTPRRDPAAQPVTITRDAVGYTVTYGTTASGCATPELAATAVRRVFEPVTWRGHGC